MRTTVTLDDDVYEIASLYAYGKGQTLSKALCELVRKGREADLDAPVDMSSFLCAPNGLLIFAPKGRVITDEMVKAALEEELD